VKLFVITKEKGKLCNFYTGLITCELRWTIGEVEITSVLQYSQYDRLGRYSAKEPKKFKTIKERVYEFFPGIDIKERNIFIKRMLHLTGANQMWVHGKSTFFNETRGFNARKVK
jgi:hypothetical protein